MADEVARQTVDIVWQQMSGRCPLAISYLARHELIHQRLRGDPAQPDLRRFPGRLGAPGPQETHQLIPTGGLHDCQRHGGDVALVIRATHQEPVCQDWAERQHENSRDDRSPVHRALSTP